mmetsp:Transcript_49633/g.124800  ORF Transcript_49633/g.124800 Transcript_49633/m.124800 type:complete len:282 (+) Transcript_49633:93-938(+)
MNMEKFVTAVVAGGAAGTCEVVATYPLDVVKTRAQLATGRTPGIWATLRNIATTEGPLGLYRGIAAPIMAEAPKRACKFACNEIYKGLYAREDGTLTLPRTFAAGASAGVTEALINCPFELVKVRLQAKENQKLYRGTAHAVSTILRSEGVAVLYRGVEPMFWRNGWWNGVYFSTIGTVKAALGEEDSMFVKFMGGVVGGGVATTFATPFDVAKSRMQGSVVGAQKYRWAWQTLFTIFREEGFRACYKGYSARLLRLGPGGGVMLVAFDFFSNLLNNMRKQ